MSILKLKGSSSGYVELTAPATAGNNQITLPTTAGTVAVRDASNNVEVGTGVTIGSPSSNTFTVSTNGSERVRVDSSGRLAIGTTTPSQLLHCERTTAGVTALFGVNDGTFNPRLVVYGGSTGTTIQNTWSSSASNLIFANGGAVGSGTEAMRIDSSGRLLVGTSSARSGFQISTGFGNVTPVHQFEFNSQTYNGLSITHNAGANTYPAVLAFGKSRGSSAGSYTAVASGDGLGWLDFYGADGTNMVRAATISAEVDGTPGTNDMPGRLVFSVTRDSASSPTEALRISNTGAVTHSCNRADWGLETKNQNNSSSNYGISILCGTNAATGTNYAINIADGDGDNQGYVTFTGGTVTYGAFTAHHPCILPEADNEAGYPYGTLLETTSIEYTQKDGHNTERGILYNVRKTQAANSRAVLGAYGSSMNGGPNGETNRHQALVLGDGHILCNNSGGNIKIGDGICSSATPGIGQKATATPSMAIGIAQEDVTFADDEEVKLVAVQYGVRQFIPWGD